MERRRYFQQFHCKDPWANTSRSTKHRLLKWLKNKKLRCMSENRSPPVGLEKCYETNVATASSDTLLEECYETPAATASSGLLSVDQPVVQQLSGMSEGQPSPVTLGECHEEAVATTSSDTLFADQSMVHQEPSEDITYSICGRSELSELLLDDQFFTVDDHELENLDGMTETRELSDEEVSDTETSQATNTMLFFNCPLSADASYVLTTKFKLRHNLTDQALSDLLDLLKLHCPSPNLCLPSLYLFNKQFECLKYPLKFHYYCCKCLQEVDCTAVVFSRFTYLKKQVIFH